MGQTIFVQQLYNKGEGPYTTFKLRLQSIEEICSFFTVKLDNSTNLKQWLDFDETLRRTFNRAIDFFL